MDVRAPRRWVHPTQRGDQPRPRRELWSVCLCVCEWGVYLLFSNSFQPPSGRGRAPRPPNYPITRQNNKEQHETPKERARDQSRRSQELLLQRIEPYLKVMLSLAPMLLQLDLERLRSKEDRDIVGF